MPIQILIADDNALVRSALRQVLESEGKGQWEMVEAENGQEAVILAQKTKPALVILDLAMPLKDGFSTAREIGQLLPGTPILMHTLYWSVRVEFEAMKAGVRKTVPKSESGVLIAAVRELLGTKPASPSSEEDSVEISPLPNPANDTITKVEKIAKAPVIRPEN